MSSHARKLARAVTARAQKCLYDSMPRASELPRDTLIYPWLIENLHRLHIVREDGPGLKVHGAPMSGVLDCEIHPYLVSRVLAEATRKAPDGRASFAREMGLQVSLPHDTVWVESPGFCARPGPRVNVHGMILTEKLTEDRSLACCSLASIAVGDINYVGFLPDMFPAFVAPFFDFLLRPPAFRTFRDEGERMISPPSTIGGALASKPAPIVYVMGKDELPGEGLRRSGPYIRWVASTEVMGHWRWVPDIGKNRRGEYIEIGRTWVVPHVRRYHPDAPDPEPRTRLIVPGVGKTIVDSEDETAA